MEFLEGYFLVNSYKSVSRFVVRCRQIGQIDRFEIVPSAPRSAPTMFYQSSISHTLVVYLTAQVF